MKVSALFNVQSGDFHALKELDPGPIPLVSCGDTDNGVIGYYDIPKGKCHGNAITVAYNGSWPILSKFHPYIFGAKDDVAVLYPINEMSTLALLYAAALFNRMTWRYSYGRKCFKEKLRDVELDIPVVSRNGIIGVDESVVARVFPRGIPVVAAEISKSAGQWASAI